MIKKIFVSACFILFVLLLIPNHLSAQSMPMSLGLEFGYFVPSDWTIQGSATIEYDNFGAPVDLNATGFGQGAVVNILFVYPLRQNWGIMVDIGIIPLHGREITLALAPDGNQESYEHILDIYPLNVSLLHRFTISGSTLNPFLGAGIGLHFASWDTKHGFIRNAQYRRDWFKGTATHFSGHFLLGIQYELSSRLNLTSTVRYNFTGGDFEIKNVDTDERIEYDGIDLGGMSFKLGLNYNLN
jgi:hypothetical protein